jgi:tetratricopeptide (TPR) repeat protein
MPPEAVDWQPAIVVLASGLVLGALVTLWLRRRGVAGAEPHGAPPLELRDLDGRAAALFVQLRELEEAAAKRTPEQLARERYALELEAARALQSRDAMASRLDTKATAAAAAPAQAGGAARGFLWGVGSTAAIAALVFYVSQSATQRQEGGSPTGNGMGSAPRAAAGAAASGNEAPEDARTTELRQTVAKNPDDLDARLELARQLLGQHDLMGVWNETQYVLERQPGHPRALSYQSLVRLAMGQGDVAVSMLKQAIAADPKLIEAHENLAFVYTSLGRTKEAEAAVAETTRLSPEDGERLKHALVQLAASRRERAVSPEGVQAHAEVPPPADEAQADTPAAPAPGGAPAPPAAGARAGTGAVFGWIEADAGVTARIGSGSVIFLTVRPAGVSQGPPVAVKRLAPGRFPMQFEVTAQDSMMGQALPDSLRIDVRADSDGDPLTRPASDPAGFADGIALGRTGVRITLK